MQKTAFQSCGFAVNSPLGGLFFFCRLSLQAEPTSTYFLDQLRNENLDMSAELKTRITGKVVHTEKKNFGSGERAFSFIEAHIQTSTLSIVPVRFTDRWEWDQPRPGDILDLEVSVTARPFRGNVDLQATAFRYFDEDYIVALQALQAAA